MKKCISYALFGFNKERHANCFDFNSYLRGLTINVRLNRLLYPGWEIVVHMDQSTYDGFPNLFNNIGIVVKIEPDAPLCLAMLWRLKPAFETELGQWKYSHVICRDLDSPPTYREVQAVTQWIANDKAMHAITDSVSHSIALLGGMIGVRPAYFNERVAPNWNAMIALGSENYNAKGTDQNFLNKIIYPKFATPGSDSITQHYVLGMGNTFLQDYHSSIPDIMIGLPDELRESNTICGHIGAAGAYQAAQDKFLLKYWDKFSDILEAEKQFPKIFYWTL